MIEVGILVCALFLIIFNILAGSANHRFLMFLGLCIPARLLLIRFLANTGYVGRVCAAAIGASFAYRYISEERRKAAGLGLSPGFFGGNVYWSENRIVHSIAHLIFAGTGYTEVLYADLIFGIGTVVKNYMFT